MSALPTQIKCGRVYSNNLQHIKHNISKLLQIIKYKSIQQNIPSFQNTGPLYTVRFEHCHFTQVSSLISTPAHVTRLARHYHNLRPKNRVQKQNSAKMWKNFSRNINLRWNMGHQRVSHPTRVHVKNASSTVHNFQDEHSLHLFEEFEIQGKKNKRYIDLNKAIFQFYFILPSKIKFNAQTKGVFHKLQEDS